MPERSNMQTVDHATGPHAGAQFQTRRSIEQLKVVILSNVRLYREGLGSSLSLRDEVGVIGAYAPTEELLDQIAHAGPAAVVLDIATPRALDLAKELYRSAPGIRVIAFGISETEHDLVACAEAGILGYVACDGSVDDLVQSICSAVSGEVICSPRHAAILITSVAARHDLYLGCQQPVLTRREREIASLVKDGKSNKEIARSLHIGAATVKNHVHSILTKLQASTRGEAAARFRAEGSMARPGRATAATIERNKIPQIPRR